MSALFAHEVYVLDKNTIESDLQNHSVNIWHALNSMHNWMLFWVFFIVIGGLFIAAFFYKHKPFFMRLGSKLDKTMVFVPDVIRVAFGASLLFSVTHSSLYGPELPLNDLAGGKIIQAFLWAAGTGLIFGIWSRMWSVITILIWCWAFLLEGPYMLTYINYVGEAIAVILLPMQKMSVDYLMTAKSKAKQIMKYSEYSMPVARILFGFSLIFTAVTVKFFDTALTLDVVNQYDLTRFFPFDPLFIVLGAALIEVAVAVLIMAGITIRFTSFIFLIVMTLSLIFFKESVWPHYLLIALGIGVFLHKPDKWTVDNYLSNNKQFKKKFIR